MVVRTRQARPIGVVAAGCALLVLLAGCTGSPAPRRPDADLVRVASFDFPESRVLAEIYAVALERHGFRVRRLLGLGSREVVGPALDQGLVDLVPEYAGSALRFRSAQGARPGATTAATMAALSAELGPHGLVALQPAEAQDQNGIVVTTGTARRYRLHSVSDLAAMAPRAAFGAPPECPERPFCLLGLKGRYRLGFRSFVPMPTRAAIAEALLTGEVQVGMLETTDPGLADRRLVLLRDDRRLQPPENIVPVVRRRVLDRHGPRFRALLDSVTGRLTTAGLVQLNREVLLQHRSVSEAAGGWLTRNRV